MIRLYFFLQLVYAKVLKEVHWRSGFNEAIERYGNETLKSWYRGVLDDDGCMGDATLTGRQVFLPEINTNGSVLIPRRATDLDCYASSKFQQDFGSCEIGQKNEAIAITVNGELQRFDPNTSIPLHVVRPYVRSGFDVTVFLTLQSRRPKLIAQEWHSARFRTMPQYNDDEEIQLLEGVAKAFLDSGAKCVKIHLYNLIRRPPQMPSWLSGANPGKASVNRFQLVWPSYVLHLLVHSMVWRDVIRAEHLTSSKFDFIFKMRADSGWLGDTAVVYRDIEADAVAVKACLEWEGVNDKLALIPGRYANKWMDLLSAYYDDSLFGYKNSEQYQQKIAHLYHIPIRRYKNMFPMIDYWWLRDLQGNLGCFPWNYAGVAGGHRCACVDHVLCTELTRRMLCWEAPAWSWYKLQQQYKES